MFLLSAILCAVSVNIPMLLVFRLIMGVSNTSLGGGYVADLMMPEHRGRAMNVWTVGPVLVRRSSIKVAEWSMITILGIGSGDRTDCRRLYIS